MLYPFVVELEAGPTPNNTCGRRSSNAARWRSSAAVSTGHSPWSPVSFISTNVPGLIRNGTHPVSLVFPVKTSVLTLPEAAFQDMGKMPSSKLYDKSTALAPISSESSPWIAPRNWLPDLYECPIQAGL